MFRRIPRALCLLVLAAASHVGAQDLTAAAPPPGKRPGRYKIGPFYLTPRLRIGTLGADTNVFYTATDRRADFSAAGGPGLEMVVPVRRSLRVRLDGGADYVYFLRTPSQRRLGGNAQGSFDWTGARTELRLEAGERRTFARPSEEIDQRILLRQTHAAGQLRRRVLGRTTLELSASLVRYDAEQGSELRGTDLHRTLSRDVRSAGLALEQGLSVKSRFVLESQLERSEFGADATRDGDRLLVAGGFRTDTSALVSGRALGGTRGHRTAGESRWRASPYADLDAVWNLSRRTRIGGAYGRDLVYTAFSTAGRPTATREWYSASVEREVHRTIDVRLAARRSLTRTVDAVRLTLASGEIVDSARQDVARSRAAEIGYRLRPPFRMALTAGWSDRRSSVGDLGVEGLLLGARIDFQP